MAQNVKIGDASSDLAALPPPVAAIRKKILAACARRDIEALRIPIEWNEMRPLFERGNKHPLGTDPILVLKSLSFDGNGLELLDLCRNVLRQPFVFVQRGPTQLYVWPAFAIKPPATPSVQERQAMLSCVRFADFLHFSDAPPLMRLAIGADGVWHYFWSYANGANP